MNAPRIALTLGDVAGIGPEIVARAMLDPAVRAVCRPVAVGDPRVLARALRLIGATNIARSFDPYAATPLDVDPPACWDPCGGDLESIAAGTIDARAGRAAYEWLVAATKAALDGRFDAIVTAPLNKAALSAAGLAYPGHTEVLAAVCAARSHAMMLFVPPGVSGVARHGLGVAHVTLHAGLAAVPQSLSVAGIAETIALLDGFLRRIGCRGSTVFDPEAQSRRELAARLSSPKSEVRPRIGVSALNPHAGEGGLFGDEESRIIGPAVAEALAAGARAEGPIPADALFRRALAGEFDGIVAMYHDQGHIPIKLAARDQAVNVTLGLPIVRTSPSHGTAFDIAWKGTANPAGMIEAIRVAAVLAGERAEAAALPSAGGSPSPAAKSA
jgi:4-hydroxythreonine-4-phosphate dehydrogenase